MSAVRRTGTLLLSLLMAALLLVTTSAFSSSAASSQPISIHMTLVDTQLSGEFQRGDILRITVNVYVGSQLARGGITYLTTNDPQERTLCNITVLPRNGDYCNIDFPNNGHWSIIAKYAAKDSWPPRYVATQHLAVAIPTTTSPPTTTTTTLPQPYAQPTTTSVQYDDLFLSGKYSPLVGATVYVTGRAGVSPGSGTVTFLDANGEILCEAVVGLSDFVECDGFPSPTPHARPIIGYYSGTSTGFNDGIGSVYAASSGRAY